MDFNFLIQINDIKLNYYEKGKRNTLLLLHGNRGHGLSESGNIPYQNFL